MARKILQLKLRSAVRTISVTIAVIIARAATLDVGVDEAISAPAIIMTAGQGIRHALPRIILHVVISA